MKSFSTRQRAERFLQEKGFQHVQQAIIGAANWRGPYGSYAWIEYDWCRSKRAMRYFVQARG